ncbi:MAG: efflux RND transporter periplasmic adaptor subunit [Myxococcales bacterium]|nr:efflux RND transporter periplasmic adaptor subunit [Myxococcales bacterium]
MNRTRLISMGFGLVLLLGCTKKEPAVPEEKAAHGEHKEESGEHEELPRRVTLSPEVVKSSGIKTEQVKAQKLPATVDLTGEVAADPDQSVRIVARVGGRILDVRFKEGQRVTAGTLLAVVESTDLARTQADYLSSQAKAQAAQKNAERVAALSQSGLAAGQEVLSAQAEARSLQAETQAAERTLRSAGLSGGQLGQGSARLEVRAPIGGVTLSRHGIVGQTVPAGHVFTDVVNLDRAYFVGRLFEKNLARVRVGEAAEIHLNAYPDAVFVGKVETIGKQIDPIARTVLARITISDHNELLKVGLFGNARVNAPPGSPSEEAAAKPRLVVPLGAVTEIAGKPSVFVRQPDGHFEVHPVTLGRSAGGLTEVLSGLRAGEEVVIDGAFTLKSVVLKGTFGEEE